VAAVVGLAIGLMTSGCGAEQQGRPAAARVATTAQGVPDRPNIVVVMADDMRADDLRFMPHVRGLVVDRGLSFRNSFSPYPLCCPARASFLTGQYPHNHRILSNEEPWGFGAFDDRATVATSLRAAGYRTGFVGKYLNNYGAVPSVVTGEPSWHYVPAGWSDWRGLVQLPPDSRIESGGTYDYYHPILNVDGRTVDLEGRYQTRVVGHLARDLVTKYAASADPFFLYLSALAPHTGFPEEPDDVVRDGGVDTWLSTPARPDWVKGRFDRLVTRSPGIPTAGQPEPDLRDKPRAVRAPRMDDSDVAEDLTRTRQRAEALYVLDREIGRLVETLRETGTLDRTVLMFTSDNGYFLGEHRRRSGKTLPYEPALRVPFLVTGPGVPHGVRFDPVKTPDLPATILDLADAEAPHLADGVSLVDVIEDGDRGWSVPVLTEALVDGAASAHPGFTDARTTIGLRTARYKLVRWATGEVELYDLATDPNELANVAERPRYRDVVRDLTAAWWRYKDCAGTACARPLPALYAVEPGELARLTDSQGRGVSDRFGVSWLPSGASRPAAGLVATSLPAR
jgi:arylsulfatase A-like enzyme